MLMTVRAIFNVLASVAIALVAHTLPMFVHHSDNSRPLDQLGFDVVCTQYIERVVVSRESTEMQ